jgi:outer membrane protein OmpA-like peptidoglycan-associated protein
MGDAFNDTPSRVIMTPIFEGTDMLKITRFRLIGHLLLLCLTACSYNPFSYRSNEQVADHATGTAIGAVAGTSTGLLLGLPNSVSVALGLTGGALGYYATTERFAAGGIIQSGGQVYSIGDYTTIEIPTDSLFESNSTEFLPGYEPTLLSAVSVLNRSPANHILVSGNTSGFGSSKYERRLSEARARTIANFLWANGVSTLHSTPSDFRDRNLKYVGYGNYFPIANNIRAESIRQNSRIQITSYPPKDQICIDKKVLAFNNIGGLGEDTTTGSTSNTQLSSNNTSFQDTFKDDIRPPMVLGGTAG